MPDRTIVDITAEDPFYEVYPEWVYDDRLFIDKLDLVVGVWDVYEMQYYDVKEVTRDEAILHIYGSNGAYLDVMEKAIKRDGKWSPYIEKWFSDLRENNIKISLEKRAKSIERRKKFG